MRTTRTARDTPGAPRAALGGAFRGRAWRWAWCCSPTPPRIIASALLVTLLASPGPSPPQWLLEPRLPEGQVQEFLPEVDLGGGRPEVSSEAPPETRSEVGVQPFFVLRCRPAGTAFGNGGTSKEAHPKLGARVGRRSVERVGPKYLDDDASPLGLAQKYANTWRGRATTRPKLAQFVAPNMCANLC